MAADRSRTLEDAGKLLLRLTIGILMLFHGVPKLLGSPALDNIAGLLQKIGLPGALAYGAVIGEVLAPLLLIAGLWTRPAALVVAVNMLFAIALAHAHQVFTLGPQGGWAIELQGLFLFGAVAIALLGAGRHGIGGRDGRFN